MNVEKLIANLGDELIAMMSILLRVNDQQNLPHFKSLYQVLVRVTELLIKNKYYAKAHEYAVLTTKMIEESRLSLDCYSEIYGLKDKAYRSLKDPKAKSYVPEIFITPLKDLVDTIKGNLVDVFLKAERNNNTPVENDFFEKISITEKEILYHFALAYLKKQDTQSSQDEWVSLGSRIRLLVNHLLICKLNRLAWNLICIFVEKCHDACSFVFQDDLQLLIDCSQLTMTSDAVLNLGEIKIIADWYRYRSRLNDARKIFNNEKSMFDRQKAYSESCQSLLIDIIQESQQWITTLPGSYCFVTVGSMAKRQMTLYSDVEFALLLDEEAIQHKESYINWFKLIYYKLIMIGEDSKYYRGFRLDDLSNLEVNDVYVGLPNTIIQKYFKSNVSQYMTEAYSLLFGDFLFGHQSVWEEFEHARSSFLISENPETSVIKYQATAKQHMLEDLKKFEDNALERASMTGCLKTLFFNPLQYGILNLGLYYGIFGCSLVEVLDQLKAYIPESFISDLSNAVAFIQTLRNKAQFEARSQTENIVACDLVANNAYRLNLEEQEMLFQIIEEVIYRLYQQVRIFKNYGVLVSKDEESYSLYMPTYLKISGVQREQFLEAVKFFDPEGFEALNLRLSLMPKKDLSREYTINQKKLWKKQLVLLIKAQEFNELTSVVSKEYPKIALTFPGETTASELSITIVHQLWDVNKKNFHDFRENDKVWQLLNENREINEKNEKRKNNHYVIRIELYDEQLGNCHYFFKIDPEMAGNELFASESYQLIFGFGAPFCEVAKLEVIHPSGDIELHAVLITQAIPGSIKLEDMINSRENGGENFAIDHESYTRHLLMSYLHNSGDLHFQNSVYSLLPNVNATTRRLLVEGVSCIDHDRILMEKDFDKDRKLLLNNCFLVMDQANQRLDKNVIQDFLSINPKIYVDRLLNQLLEFDQNIRILFNEQEVKELLLKQNCVVYLTFRERLFSWVFHRLDYMQSLLRSVLEMPNFEASHLPQTAVEVQSPVTVAEGSALWLVSKIYSEVTKHYLNAFKLRNIQKRYKLTCSSTRQTYEFKIVSASNLVGNSSLYQLGENLVSGRWLYSSVFGSECRKETDLLNLRYKLERQRYHIDIIVNINRAVQRVLDLFQHCNDEKTSKFAIAAFKELPIFAQERLLTRISFDQLYAGLSKILWNVIKYIPLRKLCVNQFSGLKSKELLSAYHLLKPTLRELTLYECNELKQFIEIQSNELLESIHIESCTQLRELHINTPNLKILNLPNCIALLKAQTQSTQLKQLDLKNDTQLPESEVTKIASENALLHLEKLRLQVWSIFSRLLPTLIKNFSR